MAIESRARPSRTSEQQMRIKSDSVALCLGTYISHTVTCRLIGSSGKQRGEHCRCHDARRRWCRPPGDAGYIGHPDCQSSYRLSSIGKMSKSMFRSRPNGSIPMGILLATLLLFSACAEKPTSVGVVKNDGTIGDGKDTTPAPLNRIAFMRSGAAWVMNADGTGAEKVISLGFRQLPMQMFAPKLIPDGSGLLISSTLSLGRQPIPGDLQIHSDSGPPLRFDSSTILSTAHHPRIHPTAPGLHSFEVDDWR